MDTTEQTAYCKIPTRLIADPQRSAIAVRLYGLLEGFSMNGVCDQFSRAWFARRMGCSVDTIDRAVKELDSNGWISRTAQKRSDGGLAPTIYELKGL